MSTKFEQLLDYLVNEEHEKANELFHEIVVEKSRSIYENLIAEEEDEDMDESADDEEMDEAKEEDDEEMDESKEEDMDESADDEEMDESEEELEDSYMMDGEDDGFGGGSEGDATDELGSEIGAEHGEDEFEKSEDDAIMDIKTAIQELEAAFAELEQAQGSEEHAMGMDGDDDQDDDQDETMGMPTMENRRVTREYVEKVGNDWDKNSQKTQGQIVGKNTGDSMPTATEPATFKWGNGKPTSSASAKNLDQSATEGQHNTGTTPNKVNKGITPEKGEQYTGKDWETNSAPGGKAGVKNLSKVGDAKGLAGATKNNGSEGTAAGAGTGNSSVKGSTNTKSIVDKKF
jgi:hypothetical protein